MKRLRPVATYHVVGIGEAIVGRLGPSVSPIRLLPLKLRAFIDFAAPRPKLALSDGSDRSRSLGQTS
jgi:hypothetical protein